MSTFGRTKIVLAALSATLVLCIVSCRSDKSSFSFKPAGTTYKPTASQVLNKLDILWVVDNSGSMASLQASLGSNFSSFVSSFTSHGYDYQLAVTTSDAYKADPTLSGYAAGNSGLSAFKKVGACNGSYTPCSTATPIVTPSTPNYLNTFINNALVGTVGSGDERAFSSFRAAFNDATNSSFLRSDSFLAIIILSDEDDFSGNSRAENSYPGGDHNYLAGTLDPVATYTTFLDTLTGTTGIYRRYSVSTITADTTACSLTYYGGAKLDAQGNQYTGQRYMSLTNSTSGVVGSICDASFANTLNNISSQITALSTQFRLDYPAQPSTIYVSFDGVSVPNDSTNGWTYSSAQQAVQFHGTYTPNANTQIFIDYLPAN